MFVLLLLLPVAQSVAQEEGACMASSSCSVLLPGAAHKSSTAW